MKMGFSKEIGKLLHVGGIIGGIGRDPQIRDALSDGSVGGVYLGYPHFQNPEAAKAMVDRICASAPYPLFIAVDFETGPGYNCAEGCAHFPYFGGIGFVDDEDATRRIADITARQALAMGVNWLYSPCVDVNLRPDNPIIGIRSFGSETDHVARHGRAFVEGCSSLGVISTAKHFPSTGNTCADTHVGLARDVGDLDTWEQKSLPPFVAAIAAGVPAVMTGHAAMPFLDDPDLPATFSRKILHDLLRERLGFEGVVISDSLGMGGAGVGRTPAERCFNAFKAGNDILLTPYDPDIFPLFDRELARSPELRRQFERSLARVERLRETLPNLPSGCVSRQDNAFAEEVGRRSVRVLKGNDDLPLKPGAFACLTQWRNDETEYFPREPGVLSRFQHGVRCFDSMAPVVALSRCCGAENHAEIIRRVGDCPVVLLVSIVKNYATDPHRGDLSEGTRELVVKLTHYGKRVVLVVLGSPYVLRSVPCVSAFLCTGGDTIGNVDGALQALFGEAL
jgi:beta-N-acetylhexosaminidase